MKLVYTAFFLLMVSCYSNKPVYEYKGPCLYYKVMGIKIECMKVDSVTGNAVFLGAASSFQKGQKFFYRIRFDLKPNLEAERGNFPSQLFSKCSKESISSFVIKLRNPTNEVVELVSQLKGLDTTQVYRESPFVESNLVWYNFKDLSDFVNKFNMCHSDVRYSFLQQNGLILSGYVPTRDIGDYVCVSEVKFSDNRVIREEFIINVR
ncbi:hypothetical protein QNI16_27745 [Cytophagaceae bacterium YF14B1]|uniref:Lipoprotein n=1 Tax=Xanthocytophaga flava TaxID=3048013 RepID=A0AAE3UA39_9BACT|nr:hypothetical protein [Xanthocytophaga flavus]MDJ1484322.1 hypothetical protein [Xanthocytophaga flavus]